MCKLMRTVLGDRPLEVTQKPGFPRESVASSPALHPGLSPLCGTTQCIAHGDCWRFRRSPPEGYVTQTLRVNFARYGIIFLVDLLSVSGSGQGSHTHIHIYIYMYLYVVRPASGQIVAILIVGFWPKLMDRFWPEVILILVLVVSAVFLCKSLCLDFGCC